MSTVGIIAEYNPFHTGHAYQISEARRLTGAEHVLVIMSGDFVQRGAPAIMDKYFRTRLALEGGADYVLEMPVWMATASAADFAEGSIAILDSLDCIDYLCFGSEAGELPLLQKAAALFLEEPPVFRANLKQQLSQGKSFPKARKSSWETTTGISGDFLDLPNNILGISYLMAMQKRNSKMIPVTIPRKGSFHSTDLNQTFASASALRKSLLEAISSAGLEQFPERILPYLSGKNAASWMKQEFGHSYPLDATDFWPILKTKLLEHAEHASSFSDFPEELANRLKACHFPCTSYEELAEALKTAAYTRSRIDRCLMHLLLNIRQDEVEQFKQSGKALYARLLGFRKSHANLLRELTDYSQIPILTKAMPPKDFPNLASVSYALDTYAANLYESVKCLKYVQSASDSCHSKDLSQIIHNKKPVHEYRQKLITV